MRQCAVGAATWTGDAASAHPLRERVTGPPNGWTALAHSTGTAGGALTSHCEAHQQFAAMGGPWDQRRRHGRPKGPKCRVDGIRRTQDVTGVVDALAQATSMPAYASMSSLTRRCGPRAAPARVNEGLLCNQQLAATTGCNGSLWRALHSDPYAHGSTMHR